MSRRYSFESDPGEREPLDNPNISPNRYPPSSSRSHPQQYQQQMQNYYDQQSPQAPRARPSQGHGVQPSPSFNRVPVGAGNRRYSRDRSASNGGQAPYGGAPAAAVGAIGAASHSRHNEIVSPISPPQAPQPPPHRDGDGRYWGQDIGYAPATHAQQQPQNTITPGADNFSEAAAGGMAGIAYTVAERNARESGMEAMRAAQQPQQPGYPQQAYHGQWQNQPYAREQNPYAPADRGRQEYSQNAAPPAPRQGGYAPAGGYVDRDSQHSLQPLGAAAIAPGQASPGMRTPSRSPHSFSNDVYTDDPYQGYTRGQDPNLGRVNPHDIEDDGDDGLVYGRRGARTSMLSLGHSNKSGQTLNNAATAGVVGGAAGGGVMGALGGLGARNGSGNGYNPVHNNQSGYQGGGGSSYDLGSGHEKSEWLSKQKTSSKKWRWLIGGTVTVVIIAAIVCGVLFGVVFPKNKKSGPAKGGGTSSDTAAGDTAANGDLNLDSPDIQALMGNSNLHKVFPGMDYTPLNTQYPDCLHFPPSQNNITRDVAVLSQLTNTIRLYGTDCKQTEMTIHAIRQLKLQDTVKIWMGVWQDNNATTNARQLAQMWDIIDEYGAEPFEGIIVANEILFREQMTAWELGQLMSTVRTNLSSKGITTLPVATSDLGDKWDSNLAQASDYIMSNIHPFFGGINAKDAADWTWTFWANKNQGFFKTDKKKNVISETGWPTQGGTDCGSATVTNCPDAAVAGVEGLNKFMNDWVCEALNNGTNYFWFSAFDEPWKVRFNTPGKEWEDHWGLLDVDRNLKDGIQIPDCGGKTV